jgi:hypothetical protein
VAKQAGGIFDSAESHEEAEKVVPTIVLEAPQSDEGVISAKEFTDFFAKV